MTTSSERDPSVEAEAEHIVRDGGDVQERVYRLFVDTVSKRRLSLDQASGLVREVWAGVAAATAKSQPAGREAILGQVIGGLSNALATTATATRLALEEARGRGMKLAGEEASQLKSALGDLEKRFFSETSAAAGRIGGGFADQVTSLVEHARRTGTSIRPAVTDALSTLARHPLDAAREAAGATAAIARSATSMVAEAASGLLHAAGDLLAPRRPKP